MKHFVTRTNFSSEAEQRLTSRDTGYDVPLDIAGNDSEGHESERCGDDEEEIRIPSIRGRGDGYELTNMPSHENMGP